MRKSKRAHGGKTEDKEWDGRNGHTASDRTPTRVYAGAGSHVAEEAEGEMAGDHESYDKERDEDKRGGRAKRKSGGRAKSWQSRKKSAGDGRGGWDHKSHGGATERTTQGRFERHERKHGGHVAEIHGHGAKHRLDRPGRKRGGGVGSDVTPLSSASRTKERRDDGEERVSGGD